MASESDLVAIAQEMANLEGRFVTSGSSGMFLQADDEATFKRLAIEAKSILDSELGRGNDFSIELIHSISIGSGGYFGGPSLAAVKEARQIVEGGTNQIRRRGTSLPQKGSPTRSHYVDTTRMSELRAISNSNWDTTRLVRLCEELNTAHQSECLMTTAMVVRSIVDHVPPLFGCETFSEVTNNVAGTRSFKGSMQHLDQSLRNIADSFLHQQIRKKDSLPSPAQVDFRADLDVLLAEIVRLLR